MTEPTLKKEEVNTETLREYFKDKKKNDTDEFSSENCFTFALSYGLKQLPELDGLEEATLTH